MQKNMAVNEKQTRGLFSIRHKCVILVHNVARSLLLLVGAVSLRPSARSGA